MSTIIDERSRVELALSAIPPDVERDTWYRIAAAIKHEYGEEGFDLFDSWSRGHDRYVASDSRDTWRSLRPAGGITIGTLFHLAQQHGFDPRQHPGSTISPEVAEKRRADRQANAEAEEKKRALSRGKAAASSLVVWEKAKPARDDHPYLMRKGLSAIETLREIDADKLKSLIGYAPKSGDTKLSGRVLVARIVTGSIVTSLEFIDEQGVKSALAGGEKSSGYWAAKALGKSPDRVLIAEGVATAMSAHVATGDVALAALSCGNLKKVAERIRTEHPDAEIVILADLGNGEGDATKAALETGSKIAIPDFPPDSADATDFNDLHVIAGAEAVADAIAQASNVHPEEPPEEIVTASAKEDKKEKRSKRSADGCVPAGFTVTDRGVFYEEDDGTPHWISSTLHVRALVRDRASENWGRLLEWNDADGHPHVWAMPMEMLRSDGADMRGELARLGLDIAPGSKARNKLIEYVVAAKPKARGRCVTRTGWHNGAFVLPDQTIGQTHERVIFQAEAVLRAYSQSGTIEDWKTHVARFCSGNSRLLLAVSAAFASMLLEFSGQESGGLNFVGNSSTGKTTALRAACSVFGGKDFMQRWRATSNGLEGLASLHNDTLLVLDELAQVDAREAGEIAYMLANGSGKARAGRSGAARTRQTWQLLFLSAGEIGLSQHMQSVGKKAKAGQEVRLVEIPADAGAGLGIFNTLHGMKGGSDLSTVINDAAVHYYGTAAIEFLNAVCRDDRTEISAWLKREVTRFVSANLPPDSSGQAHRVCQRFALIGLAGEYATSAGITGWIEGEALQAAADCVAIWLDGRGGAGNQERDAILSHVKAFFEAHEESRFTDLNDTTDRPTINRAGFRRSVDGVTEYLVFPEVFKREVCASTDPKSTAKMLIESGWIKPASNGWAQRAERLPGKGPTKVYVFTSQIWEESK